MNAQLIFFTYVLSSLICGSVLAKLYIWPRLRATSTESALEALIAPQALIRLIGIGFLVPGIVSSQMNSGFAVPAAVGDYIAALLALAATVAIHYRSRLAMPLAWLFNIEATIDLLNAFTQAGLHRMAPGAFGVAFYIPTAVVPLLLVSHWLIFRLLMTRKVAV